MKLNKELAENILSAMFKGYSFNYGIDQIDDDCFDFRIKNNLDDVSNETQHIYIEFGKTQITVTLLTKSEQYKELGIYITETDHIAEKGEFIKSNDFFETMFVEHLIF